MKRKSNALFVSILLSFVVLVILNYFGVIDLLSVPKGASLIDQKTLYGDDAKMFTCETDYCTVQGSIKVSQSSSAQKVVFKYSGDYKSDVWVDMGGGILTDFSYSTTSQRRNPGTKLDFKTPNNYDIFSETSGGTVYLYIKYSGDNNGGNFYKYTVQQNQDSNTDPQYNCVTKETCKNMNIYAAYFNFCPSYDSNYPFCRGSNNYVESTTKDITYPAPKDQNNPLELTSGQSVSFNPLYKDNTKISDRSITVSIYDVGTCKKAIDQGTACDNDKDNPAKKCTPQQGSEYKINEQCYGNNDYFKSLKCNDGSSPFRKDGVDCGSSLTKPWCKGDYDYTPYVKCTSTQKINGITCGAWANSKFNAPDGQQCFLLDNNGDVSDQQGTGLGDLKCPKSKSCTIGDVRGTDGDSTYQECVKKDSCSNNYVTKSCDSPRTWNSDIESCSCPTTNACSNKFEQQCTASNKFAQCKETVKNSGCYAWDFNNPATCTGDLLCEDKSGSFDACSCNVQGANKCDPNNKQQAIKCINATDYQKCKKDTDVQCYNYRGTFQVDQPDLNICKNNEIIARTDYGCAFPGNKASELCAKETDSRGILLESCVTDPNSELYNTCQPTYDDYSATQDDANQCIGNTVYFAKLYTGTRTKGTEVEIYRKEVKTNAPNSNQGVCGDIYYCSNGACNAGFNDIGIVSPNYYGVNENIGNITVIVKNTVSGYDNVRVLSQLFENGKEIARKDANTNKKGSQGEVLVNFNYVAKRGGNLTIKASAIPSGYDLSNTPYVAQKNIYVAKRLNVEISCPPINYFNRAITCQYTIKDYETKQSVSASPTISVNDGAIDFSRDNALQTITFMTDDISSVTVTISAIANGYIEGTSQITIEVNPTSLSSVFELDNKDFFSYTSTSSGAQIDASTHQLALGYDESGNAKEIFSVDAYMKTPSGNQEKIPFTKDSSTQKWITTYTFLESGKTYEIIGSVNFADPNTPPAPFDYKFVTIKSATENNQQTNTFVGIGIGIGVLFIVIVIVFAIVLRKGKKRR